MSAGTQDASTVRLLRRGVGVAGIGLPLAVTVGNAILTGAFTLLSSISFAYYTGMRDVFVASLCAIGVFLICYRYAPLDDWLSSIAGVLAIIVALFPTKPEGKASTTAASIWIVHLTAAILLFLLLAWFCFFLFTKTAPGTAKGEVTGRKRIRNRIYVGCGIAILAGLGLAIVGSLLLSGAAERAVQPLFWGEAVALCAFGVAWLVKGETIAKDIATSP